MARPTRRLVSQSPACFTNNESPACSRGEEALEHTCSKKCLWVPLLFAGVVSNEIVQHHDWLPTLLAIAGEPDVKEKLLKGHKAAGRTFKNHIDGFNLLPYLTGEVNKSPRELFVYFSDDGDVVAIRVWTTGKLVFSETACAGNDEGLGRAVYTVAGTKTV